MYNNRKELLKMVQKYLAGKATAEEQEFLQAYYTFFEKEEDIFIHLQAEEKKLLEEELESGIWDIVEKEEKRHIRPLWYSPLRIAAAASVILAMSVTGYFILHHKTQTALTAKNDIKPGSNGAVLTLANGHKVILEQAKAGTIANESGSRVRKANDSLLEYKAGVANNAAVAYNTLETPAGKQYAVLLPDGTKAWLNAASSLKYPTAFNGKERLVELTGEAYFEVVHNARQPFRVQTANEQIEDIGTRFDVNAYNDEPIKKTTLLEGSVRLTVNGSGIVLKPGQEAAVVDEKLVVNDVDVQKAIAWKDGYFYFDHADIKAVMRQIARWYNVKVVYEGQLPKKSFKGKIYRNVSITQALKILEFFNVHYKIDGNQVTVIG